MIALAEFRNVELVRAGTFEASTGDVTITLEMLRDMVAAHKAIGDRLHAPVKLGHSSPDNLRPKGLPAFGWVENLRLERDEMGDVLVGDLSQVPEKLAGLMREGAYRTRSVEIREDFEQDGAHYPHVLVGLALLGEELPAVRDLDDVADIFSEELAHAFEASDGDMCITLTAGAETMDEKIKAALAALGLEDDASPADIMAAMGIEGDPNAAPGGPPGDPAAEPASEPEPEAEPEPEDEPAEDAKLAARTLNLEAELASVKTELAARKTAELAAAREAVIDGAIREGRYLPRQRDRLLKLAASTPLDEFTAMVGEQPAVVSTVELGSAGANADASKLEPSAGQSRVLALMAGGMQDPALHARFVNGSRLAAGLPPLEAN